MAFLEPKELTVKTQSGDERTYILHKFPAISGREIIAKYPLSGMPKLGDYKVNEETMFKLMAFVKSGDVALTTQALIENHIPDWETLARIEVAMIEYNCSFFQNGKISTFLDGLKANALKSISSMLTDSLGQLLQANKQR